MSKDKDDPQNGIESLNGEVSIEDLDLVSGGAAACEPFSCAPELFTCSGGSGGCFLCDTFDWPASGIA